MSLADIADIFEAHDTVCPCSSNEDLRRDWFADVDEMLPWNEIEEGSREKAGEYQSLTEEIVNKFFKAAVSGRWAAMSPEEKVKNVERLAATPQVPQRTAEWYAQSKTVLTASEFSCILGTPRAIGQLVMNKATVPSEQPSAPRLAVSTPEMGAMDWGVRFEPVVKQILTAMWDSEIIELGRLMHPTDTHLAASPDGLVLTAADPDRVGRLVEIKCPIRREVTGQIPFEYWCQMQIQMEVCDIDECEYVEVKLNSAYKDVPFSDEPREGTKRSVYFGSLYLLQEPDTLQLKYAYNALERKDLQRLGWSIIEEIPWNLDNIYIQVVKRDTKWFEGTAEARDAFWKKVEEARAGAFVLPPSSRPIRKKEELVVKVCKIED
jgi:putative phage-type endonuclease